MFVPTLKGAAQWRTFHQEEDYDAPHVDVDAVKANLKAPLPWWSRGEIGATDENISWCESEWWRIDVIYIYKVIWTLNMFYFGVKMEYLRYI